MGADLAGKHACPQSDDNGEPLPQTQLEEHEATHLRAPSSTPRARMAGRIWVWVLLGWVSQVGRRRRRREDSTVHQAPATLPPRPAVPAAALTALTASCCPPCLLRPLSPGPAHLKARPGWGQVPIRERAAGGRAAHLSCIGDPPLLFLFLPSSLSPLWCLLTPCSSSAPFLHVPPACPPAHRREELGVLPAPL